MDLIQLFFYEDCKILKWEEIKSIFIKKEDTFRDESTSLNT